MAYKEDLDAEGEKDLKTEPRNAIQAPSSCGGWGGGRKWMKEKTFALGFQKLCMTYSWKFKKMYISTGLIQCKLTYLHSGCTSAQRCGNAQHFFRISSLWDVALFHRLFNSRRFETIMLSRKVRNKLLSDKASYPKRRQSTATSLQNPQDLNTSRIQNEQCQVYAGVRMNGCYSGL
jgi:hypothetical protein